jgi:hypothetical protein
MTTALLDDVNKNEDAYAASGTCGAANLEEGSQRPKRPSGTFKRSAKSASPQGKKIESAFLEPLTSSVQRKRFIVYDIESKSDDTQTGGFTRPFVVGMHDGNAYLAFRNEAKVTHFPWETRHYMKGGCIDLLMRCLLTKQNSGCNIFAHNGGNFDHLFLLAWIRRHHTEFGFEVTPVQSSIQKLEVWKKEKGKPRGECEHWTFLDSVRLLPMSLAKAAETFGLAGKEEMDLNEHEDHAHWELYLRVDCEQLFQVLLKLHELIEDKLGGEVGMTAPSTSMKLFRKRFLGQDGSPNRIARHAHWAGCKEKEDKARQEAEWRAAEETSKNKSRSTARAAVSAARLDREDQAEEDGSALIDLVQGIETPRDSSLPAGDLPGGEPPVGAPCAGCAHNWIRRAYYGGRTEIFRMYGEKLHYYDINSSYVAAMAETMPVGDRIVIENPEELDWRMHEKFIGFVECTVRIPEDCPVPPLPYRATTGKLIFPVGEFEGTWDTEELNLLRDPSVGGEILSIKRVVWFGRRKVFHGMVAELWRLRDKSQPDWDEGLSALAKLMGNSLYGKFGMKEERQAIVIAKKTSKIGECFLCDNKATTPDGQMCAEHIGSKPATGSPDCDVWYQAVQVSAPYIIPHIAAHITSLARVRIWKFMMQAHNAGGTLYYTDSVTEDRTVVVRNPEDEVEILPFKRLWEKASSHRSQRGKEFGELVNYKALTEDGWHPITNILRHRAGKDTWRVSTKHGQTQVTTDHGIMVSGKETRPEDFVLSKDKFTTVSAPKEEPFKEIDLFEYVKDFSLSSSSPNGDHTYRFRADDRRILFEGMKKGTREPEDSAIEIRRFYTQGSPELSALIRLVGAYVSDGSASLVGETTSSRFMLSFCKSKLWLMERIKKDLHTIAPTLTNIFGPFWSDTVYVVRSGTTAMACFFAALAGYKCKGKRFPSFMYALDKRGFDTLLEALAEGDGGYDAANQFIFTSTSQELTAGLSYILSQHDLEHSFGFRESKEAWSIRTRPTGSERNRYSVKSEVFKSDPDEYVYDLTVDGSHTFVDGVGRVLLHNTDSLITDVVLPSSSELGALKDEYPGMTLKGAFVQPKVYLLEKDLPEGTEAALRIFPKEHLSTCKDKHCKGCADFKLAMKGFSKEYRTRENLAKLRDGEAIEMKRLQKVRSLAQGGFLEGPRMVNITKSFKSGYDKRRRSGIDGKLFENGATKSIILSLPQPPAAGLDSRSGSISGGDAQGAETL